MATAPIGAALKGDANGWLESATQKEESWWPDWQQWVSKYSGANVKPRMPGVEKAFPALEAAPGAFAAKRLDGAASA